MFKSAIYDCKFEFFNNEEIKVKFKIVGNCINSKKMNKFGSYNVVQLSIGIEENAVAFNGKQLIGA